MDWKMEKIVDLNPRQEAVLRHGIIQRIRIMDHETIEKEFGKQEQK